MQTDLTRQLPWLCPAFTGLGVSIENRTEELERRNNRRQHLKNINELDEVGNKQLTC